MHNIGRIFVSDLKRIMANAITAIITVGLVLLPSVFAWYNIIACWDVFDHTGNIKVAVANADAGYKSDLVPIEINIGDQVISSLRANEDIDWIVTDAEDAISGAESGKYYAAVVIQESFSADMMTFYADNAEHAQIVYYTNGKKNAIAPRITDQGADRVAYAVNRAFAQEIAKVGVALVQAMANASEEYDLDGNIAKLAGHLSSVSDQMDRAADTLALYGSLAAQSNQLVNDSVVLVGETQANVAQLRNEASGNAANVEAAAASVTDALNALAQALDASNQSLSGLESVADSELGALEGSSADIAASMRARADSAQQQANQMAAARDALRALQSGMAPEDAARYDAIINQLDSESARLQRVHDDLYAEAANVEANGIDADGERERIKELVAQAQAQLGDVQSSYASSIKQDTEALSAAAANLKAGVDGGLDKLDASASNLAASASSVSSGLANAQGDIENAISQLHDASGRLRALSSDILKATTEGSKESLSEILNADAEEFSSQLSAPVEVERYAIFATENFGSAMTPFYSSLGLFIGALLIMVVTRPFVPEEELKRIGNVKPREEFTGHFGIVALISFAQSTLMALGNMLFLQVQVSEPLLFLLCYWATGFVFAFISYALVVSFANLGKLIMVLMLIVQVTGGGGSYPLQIMPWFVQTISPYLPVTHVVNMMRAAMMGVYLNDFWIELGILLLYLIPALLIGYILRRPIENFMKWYIQKVEASKVMS